MTRVVATGTFDILHPGHLWYLSESAKLGDELWVIIARDVNVKHKPKPVIPEEQRCNMVGMLKPVTHACLGDKTDMFRLIREIKPDIITIGCNQHFDPETLAIKLKEQGMSVKIIRISKYTESKYTSSSKIVREIIERAQRPGSGYSPGGDPS
jgi:FAD synthetase